MKNTLLITLLIFLCLPSIAQKLIPLPNVQEDWTKPYPPFRIAGTLYYVGTYDLACYLITTRKGDISINTGSRGSAPMIRSNVEALGFKFSDIKYYLLHMLITTMWVEWQR